MNQELPSLPKSKQLLNPEISLQQAEAITELDALLHPAILPGFLQTASRDQWRKIAYYMDALKDLLPQMQNGE
jgi:hypothetical protein